jgi:hypothetical protein
VAEGVLGPFFGKVCPQLKGGNKIERKLPTDPADKNTHDFRPWHFDEINRTDE